MMKTTLPFLILSATLLLVGHSAEAQKGPPCDPAFAPDNLTSAYTPGVGAQLNWDAIDGSLGVRILATVPGGASVSRTIVGFEPDAYLVPDAVLGIGVYTWRVLATCTTTPPYQTTPISVSDTFTVGAPLVCPASVTDADGNVYPVVKIGQQCWMQENLKTASYANGAPVQTGLSSGAWQSTSQGAARPYDNDPANILIYGQLYNFHAVEDSRGICPTGWHVPSLLEWEALEDELGGPAPGENVGGQMRSTGDLSAGTGLWQAPNGGATNSSGFSGLPGGKLLINTAALGLGTEGQWWSTDVDAFGSGEGRVLSNSDFSNSLGLFSNAKNGGASIRCLQD